MIKIGFSPIHRINSNRRRHVCQVSLRMPEKGSSWHPLPSFKQPSIIFLMSIHIPVLWAGSGSLGFALKWIGWQCCLFNAISTCLIACEQIFGICIAQRKFLGFHRCKSRIFVHCNTRWNFQKDITLKRQHRLRKFVHPFGAEVAPGPLAPNFYEKPL